MKYSILFFIVAFTISGNSFAQKPSNLHFHQLPFDNLSYPTVNCIYQDETGFLWFGTPNGLNRYDGYEYKVYQSDKNSQNGLSSNYINSINQDSKGNLWIATKYGLNVLMKNTNEFKTYLPEEGNINSIANPNVEIIYRDSKDQMWVGTWGGLSRYEHATDNFINYVHNPEEEGSISGNVVTSILEDGQNRLWVGTAFSGLNLHNQSSEDFRRFKKELRKESCISGNSISTIYEDKKGQIWVGVEGGGLNRFIEESQTFKWYMKKKKETSIASSTVYSIVEDKHGSLMIGGMNGGISVYNATNDNFTRFDTYGNYNAFGNKASVFCHYKLKSGEVLIATSNGGVKIQDNYPMGIELYQHIDGNETSLPVNNVSCLEEDHLGNFWIGTIGGGLSYFNATTKKFDQYSAFDDKTINALYLDNKSDLWIATLENGLSKYAIEEKQFQYYRHDPDDESTILSDFVNHIIEDPKGLWIGTDKGLCLLNQDNQSFSRFKESKSGTEKRPIGRVNQLLIDYTYKLWVISEYGLHYYAPEKNTLFNHGYDIGSQDLQNNWISYIHEDSHQHLWLSTIDGNLKLLDVNRKIVELDFVNPKQKITEVTNVMEDNNGFYWITCRQGLLKCEVDHKTYTAIILNSFNQYDELQDEPFNTNAGLFSTKTGEILIGGFNGLNVFNPNDIKINPVPPPIVLTQVKVNNMEIDTRSEMKEITLLNKESSSIDIHFSALNYVKPLKNQYAYKLEGYDDKWQFTGSKRVASYGGLPTGSYELKIKGSNNDGVWNSQGINLNIIVIPLFWQTAMFKLGLLATSLMLIVICLIVFKRYKSKWAVFAYITNSLVRNHQNTDHHMVLSNEAHDDDFIKRAIAFVESNIDNEELSIEEMCVALASSRAQIFRKIKNLSGKTVSNFIRDIRLEKAKLYLDSNPKNISDVVYATGFKSHAHFSRAFKEKFGKSPSAYIQR
ncbi:MAG: helix-turn-helix domain-containing protein [Cyclobacteriaceae bacterium]